VTTYL